MVESDGSKRVWRTNAKFLIAVVLLSWVAACDRMITPHNTQVVKDADSKTAQGDYLRAINLYESVLDGTPETAEIHYKLGLLYDDKLNDPVNALHHFKRYIAMRPDGSRASEVKQFIKRDETALLTSLSGDSLVTQAEAARLRNENLNLRKQLEARGGAMRPRDDATKPRAAAGDPKADAHEKQSYVVKKGDTLASISRKFYHSPSHWKKILDANSGNLESPTKLSPGMTLTIP